jgi:hypothetical protein
VRPRTVFPAFSLQNTCVYVSNPLFPFKFTSPSYVISLSATCQPALAPDD